MTVEKYVPLLLAVYANTKDAVKRCTTETREFVVSVGCLSTADVMPLSSTRMVAAWADLAGMIELKRTESLIFGATLRKDQNVSDLQRRSEALLRQRGYLTGSVERRKRFPAHGKPACKVCGARPMIDISHDLWNCFDLVAMRPAPTPEQAFNGTVFVQVTSSANHATRRNKIIASAEARLCLLSGARILIQSWKKRDNRWQSADEWISLDQFVVGLPDTVEQFYVDQARLNLLNRKKRLPAFPPGATLPLSDMLKDEEIPF